VKFTIIKSCLARFSGIFALGTPSNIHGTAISYRCAKFGAFVNSETILILRDLTIMEIEGKSCDPRKTCTAVFSHGGASCRYQYFSIYRFIGYSRRLEYYTYLILFDLSAVFFVVIFAVVKSSWTLCHWSDRVGTMLVSSCSPCSSVIQ